MLEIPGPEIASTTRETCNWALKSSASSFVSGSVLTTMDKCTKHLRSCFRVKSQFSTRNGRVSTGGSISNKVRIPQTDTQAASVATILATRGVRAVACHVHVYHLRIPPGWEASPGSRYPRFYWRGINGTLHHILLCFSLDFEACILTAVLKTSPAEGGKCGIKQARCGFPFRPPAFQQESVCM